VPAGLDARSFAGLLRGETQAHREVQIAQLPTTQCVRDGRWKAILNPNDRPELYDLADDPGEGRNRYAEHPEVYRRLARRLTGEVTGGLDLNG